MMDRVSKVQQRYRCHYHWRWRFHYLKQLEHPQPPFEHVTSLSLLQQSRIAVQNNPQAVTVVILKKILVEREVVDYHNLVG